VELLIAAIAGYSGIFAPMLAAWAICTLCLHSHDSDFGYCQTVFFGSMLVIAFLTVRTMLMHDPCWLLNASSLGVLVVGGALKGREVGASSVLSGN